jgi:hypothetical protein
LAGDIVAACTYPLTRAREEKWHKREAYFEGDAPKEEVSAMGAH